MFEHLQSLNLLLQGKEKNIIDLSQTVFSFEAKFKLFVNDIKNETFNHFPRVKSNVTNLQKEKLDEYIAKLKELQEDFRRRFADLRSLKSLFTYFINPFTCDVIEGGLLNSEILVADKAATELELLEIKEDQALQMIHK